MKQAKTIFAFEYLGYWKNKTFLVSSLVLMALLALLPIVPTVMGVFSRRGDDGYVNGGATARPAVIVDAGRIHDVDGLAAGFFSGFAMEQTTDYAAALLRLDNGDIAFVLHIDGLRYDFYVPSVNMTNQAWHSWAQQYLVWVARTELLAAHGMDETVMVDYGNLAWMVGGPMHSRDGASVEAFFQNYLYSVAAVFLLFISIQMYGSFISTSIVTEKSSKCMEILITAAKPIQLMFGKVLGVTFAAITQLVMFLGAAALSLAINAALWSRLFLDGAPLSEMGQAADHNLPGIFDFVVGLLSPEGGMLLLLTYLIAFYLLGFVLYAFLYAAFASTASSMEQVNTVGQYPMLLLMGAYLPIIFGMQNPGATWITIMSFIPFFTPIIMMVRYTMGVASHPEILISLGILVATIVVMAYLSAKIYRVGVMLYGNPPKLRDLFKMIRTMSKTKVG